MELESVFDLIRNEIKRAIDKFPPFASAHEGYAIILEEVRELEYEVFKNQKVRNIVQMHIEALQVAAMAIRFILDVPKEGEK